MDWEPSSNVALAREVLEAWKEFRENSMDGIPFLVSTMVNNKCFADTLVDTGCLSYGLISERFATRNNLQRINIPS